MNRRVMESLIKAGAMDCLRGNRAQMTAVIDERMETGQRGVARIAKAGQAGLFGDRGGRARRTPSSR